MIIPQHDHNAWNYWWLESCISFGWCHSLHYFVSCCRADQIITAINSTSSRTQNAVQKRRFAFIISASCPNATQPPDNVGDNLQHFTSNCSQLQLGNGIGLYIFCVTWHVMCACFVSYCIMWWHIACVMAFTVYVVLNHCLKCCIPSNYTTPHRIIWYIIYTYNIYIYILFGCSVDHDSDPLSVTWNVKPNNHNGVRCGSVAETWRRRGGGVAVVWRRCGGSVAVVWR